MKKNFSILLALVMLFTCLCGTSVFAAENTTVSGVSVEDEVTPRGTLSGYGNVWHTAGTSTTGTFDVVVTGSAWITAQVSFGIENFGPSDAVAVKLYRPNGSLAYSSLDYPGDMITMANTDDSKWKDIVFSNGEIGTYHVEYSIFNYAGNTPGSGRINCWIF